MKRLFAVAALAALSVSALAGGDVCLKTDYRCKNECPLAKQANSLAPSAPKRSWPPRSRARISPKSWSETWPGSENPSRRRKPRVRVDRPPVVVRTRTCVSEPHGERR
jgi:hypothetical protein